MLEAGKDLQPARAAQVIPASVSSGPASGTHTV